MHYFYRLPQNSIRSSLTGYLHKAYPCFSVYGW